MCGGGRGDEGDVSCFHAGPHDCVVSLYLQRFIDLAMQLTKGEYCSAQTALCQGPHPLRPRGITSGASISLSHALHKISLLGCPQSELSQLPAHFTTVILFSSGFCGPISPDSAATWLLLPKSVWNGGSGRKAWSHQLLHSLRPAGLPARRG